MDQKLLLPLAGGAGVVIVLLAVVIFFLIRGKKKRRRVEEVQAALPGRKGEQKAIGPTGASASAQMEAKIAERENKQRQLETDAIAALKLPPVVTKKSEVLTKHLRENIKKDPGVAAQVLLGWMRDGES